MGENSEGHAAAEQAARDQLEQLQEQARRLGPEWFRQYRADQALILEAEAAAGGYLHLCVVHGDPESTEDIERFAVVTRAFWDHPAGQGRATQGGHHYTVFRAGPPTAAQVLADVLAVAREHSPGWWRISFSSRP